MSKDKMKIACIHLIDPLTPSMAGRFVGTIELPDDFVMPSAEEKVQFEGCGLIVSVAEVEKEWQ